MAALEPDAAAAGAATAVGEFLPQAETSVSVGGEFVRVEVQIESPGLPLIGVGQRTLMADAAMRREDILE